MTRRLFIFEINTKHDSYYHSPKVRIQWCCLCNDDNEYHAFVLLGYIVSVRFSAISAKVFADIIILLPDRPDVCLHYH